MATDGTKGENVTWNTDVKLWQYRPQRTCTHLMNIKPRSNILEKTWPCLIIFHHQEAMILAYFHDSNLLKTWRVSTEIWQRISSWARPSDADPTAKNQKLRKWIKLFRKHVSHKTPTPQNHFLLQVRSKACAPSGFVFQASFYGHRPIFVSLTLFLVLFVQSCAFPLIHFL